MEEKNIGLDKKTECLEQASAERLTSAAYAASNLIEAKKESSKLVWNEFIENKIALFEKILKEDVCASDFSGFTPENVIDLKKKEEEGEAQVC